MQHGDYKCPWCKFISWLKWDDEDAGWKAFKCHACGHVVSRLVCEKMLVPHYFMVTSDEADRDIRHRQTRRVYKDLSLDRCKLGSGNAS